MRHLTALLPALLLAACSSQPIFILGSETSLARINGGVSRAITWENRDGRQGGGGRSASALGVGRKGSPAIPNIAPGETVTLMDVQGSGVIRHIWATIGQRGNPHVLRNLILRMYWDHSEVPSVEVPWGDFFAMPHGELVQLDSALVHTGHEPGRSFNCYFPMPFGTGARITLANEGEVDTKSFYYQIDYERFYSQSPSAGRFHAVFQRVPVTTMKADYELMRTGQGPGHLVGIVMGLHTTDANWWGEGEVKAYMDGDGEFPTICGTGLEDYYCTAFGMGEFQTLYAGCPRMLKSEEHPNPVVSLYRWHVLDPLRWSESLRLTVQQIGWMRGKGLYERSDDVCSVVYYYVPRPEPSRPPLPDAATRNLGLRVP